MSKEECVGKTDYDIVSNEEADRKVTETHSPITFRDTVSFPSGQMTLVDHKFPVAVKGHPHAVGRIAMTETPR